MSAEPKNAITHREAPERPPQPQETRPIREGIAALQYMVEQGIKIKKFYTGGPDTNPGTYSTATPIEQGKVYKVYIQGRFLCLDIDRNHKDGEDGIANFYQWLESIGHPRAELPTYFQDIEGGSFPCFMKTPNDGFHLYFRYSGEPVLGTLCPGVEIKTLQVKAGYRQKDGKPYTLYGGFDMAPPVPYFIAKRLSKKEKPTPVFIPPGKKRFEGGTPWPKIIEFTDKDGRGTAGRDAYAYSLAVHAKTHGWLERETERALEGMVWNFDASFTPAQLKKCCRSAYA